MELRRPVAADEIAAFARLSIFGALSPGSIRFLLERAEDVKVPRGGTFFVQGDSGDSVFVLREGEVEVVRTVGPHRRVLCRLGPGDCFGEMSLVAICARHATVRALADSTALKLRNGALLELYQHDLEQFTLLQMNLGRELARRLAAADAALFEHLARAERSAPETDADEGRASGSMPA